MKDISKILEDPSVKNIVDEIGPEGIFFVNPQDYPNLPCIPDRILIPSFVIGYMLMVKRNKKLDKFKDEFNAIRHGDYDTLYQLIKRPQSLILSIDTETGKIENSKDQEFSQKNGFLDFAVMVADGPSFIDFFYKCYDHYGILPEKNFSKDRDKINIHYSNEIFNFRDKYNILFNTYCHLAYFEIGLRMAGNNMGILPNHGKFLQLHNIIEMVGKSKNMDQKEIGDLRKSNQILNKIKHGKNISEQDIHTFISNYLILTKYHIASNS